MKREFLKELGLEDEAINKIMAEHGKSVNDIKEKAEKVDTLESQINDYKQQLEDRDAQLQELGEKAQGNEELTSQIEELKQQNEITKNEYEEKLNQQAFEHKLESSLSGAKARNIKSVKANLDLDAIKLKDGELIGLKEQLESLKETDAYLFEEDQEETPKPSFTTGQHNKKGDLTANDLTKMSYKDRVKFKRENPTKYNQLVGK